MKKQILKNLFLVLCILSPFFAAAQATTITFSGTGFLTANSWTTHSGTTGQLSSLATASDVGNSLSYTGLPTSTNNRTTTIAGNSEDVNYVVSTITNAGSVYYSTLIKLTNTTGQAANTTTGNYFMNLTDTNGAVVTTGFVGRLYVRAGATANTFNLGVLNNSGGTALAANIYGATPVDYAINTTYLVVVKYTYSTNTASLWVNPTVSATEPTALVSTNIGTGAAPLKSKAICIRQTGTISAGTGNIEIDEIRVANNWSDVLGVVAVTNPSVKFNPTTLTVNENAGTATVTLNITNPNATATSVDVKVKGGTATAGTDYTFSSTTVTIPAYKDSTVNLSAAILNDMLVEGNETIILAIRNISNAGVIGADSILTITLNDDEVPFYPISDLRVNDSNGNPIFPLATPLAIRGVVYSPNLRAAGLQFSLVDATGAMTIFKANGNLGYTVTLGDSLAIYGKLSPYNGLNEVAVDSFKVLATGIALKAPKVVTKLKEEDESNIVKVLKVRVIDPAQWTKTGSGFNVKITNGTDSMDMRILNSVDLYTMDAPIGDFNVNGVVSQFDASNPKNSGYQLMPRGSSDIYVIPAPPVDPTVAIELGTYTTLEGAGTATIKLVLNKPAFDSVYVNFDVAGGTATPGQDYSIATPNPIFFNIGDSVKTVTINIVNDIKVETAETINVEISNPLGATLGNRTTAVMTINDNDTLVGINTNAKAGIAVYPNPAHGLVNIKTVETITKIQVINVIGQIVLEKSNINNNFSSIELKTIESGVYTILVSTENGVIASKFIKQ